jgi:hypothetical protein
VKAYCLFIGQGNIKLDQRLTVLPHIVKGLNMRSLADVSDEAIGKGGMSVVAWSMRTG